MQLPGVSKGSTPGAPRGLIGGLVDHLINKPLAAPPQGKPGLAQQGQQMAGPSPAQQIAKNSMGTLPLLNDPSASIKARALYALGVRRSDNPYVQMELEKMSTNPPATPLRTLGQGLLVTGTVNRLLQ